MVQEDAPLPLLGVGSGLKLKPKPVSSGTISTPSTPANGASKPGTAAPAPTAADKEKVPRPLLSDPPKRSGSSASARSSPPGTVVSLSIVSPGLDLEQPMKNSNGVKGGKLINPDAASRNGTGSREKLGLASEPGLSKAQPLDATPTKAHHTESEGATSAHADGSKLGSGRTKSEGAELSAEAAVELEELRERVRELTQRNGWLEARLQEVTKSGGDTELSRQGPSPSLSILSGTESGSERAIGVEEGGNDKAREPRKRDNRKEAHLHAVTGSESDDELRSAEQK